MNRCEVASLLVDVNGLQIAVINTYWEPNCTQADLILCQEMVGMHHDTYRQDSTHLIILAGDMNVNMLLTNTGTSNLTEFIDARLGLTRQDMVGDNVSWHTRIRSGTHLDCLAYSCDHPHEILRDWNHQWAGDDHTSLGLEIIITYPTTIWVTTCHGIRGLDLEHT